MSEETSRRETLLNAGAGVLCAVAVAWTLHVALSGGEFRARRGRLEKDLAAVESLERGDAAAAAWKARAERGGERAADPAPVLAGGLKQGAAVVESRSEESLGGGWTRRECVVRARGADYAELAALLAELRGTGDAGGWRLRSGEWTPGADAGRGDALLVLETLDSAGGE